MFPFQPPYIICEIVFLVFFAFVESSFPLRDKESPIIRLNKVWCVIRVHDQLSRDFVRLKVFTFPFCIKGITTNHCLDPVVIRAACFDIYLVNNSPSPFPDINAAYALQCVLIYYFPDCRFTKDFFKRSAEDAFTKTLAAIKVKGNVGLRVVFALVAIG